MTGVAMDRKMTAAIWVGFLFEGCVFDFTDAPPNSDELLVGGKIESAIVGVQSGLNLTLLLLRDES